MLYVQHWSFKAGYHQKGAEKFLGGGGDYPGVEMIGRYHGPGSLEGWIVLKTDDPKAIYQHAAEWAEFLNSSNVQLKVEMIRVFIKKELIAPYFRSTVNLFL